MAKESWLSCSPDCSSVTGMDLFNSRSVKTLDLDNSGGASNTVFYARWSLVQICNTGAIGALVGQTVELQNMKKSSVSLSKDDPYKIPR